MSARIIIKIDEVLKDIKRIYGGQLIQSSANNIRFNLDSWFDQWFPHARLVFAVDVMGIIIPNPASYDAFKKNNLLEDVFYMIVHGMLGFLAEKGIVSNVNNDSTRLTIPVVDIEIGGVEGVGQIFGEINSDECKSVKDVAEDVACVVSELNRRGLILAGRQVQVRVNNSYTKNKIICWDVSNISFFVDYDEIVDKMNQRINHYFGRKNKPVLWQMCKKKEKSGFINFVGGDAFPNYHKDNPFYGSKVDGNKLVVLIKVMVANKNVLTRFMQIWDILSRHKSRGKYSQWIRCRPNIVMKPWKVQQVKGEIYNAKQQYHYAMSDWMFDDYENYKELNLGSDCSKLWRLYGV